MTSNFSSDNRARGLRYMVAIILVQHGSVLTKTRRWFRSPFPQICSYTSRMLDCFWNVMAHEQKPEFLFRRDGRVHLNRRGHQFSRLLAAELCASAVVMLDTTCSEVVWRVLATHSIPQLNLHFPTHARHRVPSRFSWTLQKARCQCDTNLWPHVQQVRNFSRSLMLSLHRT